MMDPVSNAAVRFAALSAIFDPGSRRHLLDRGVAPGWNCLEVGGGGGSIARWLSERVGDAGRVLVTDIDTHFLEALAFPNLEVLRHDITRDRLPEGAFDLVHTRMVLIHLPEGNDVLRRLVAALKPGGWLVCEEFDAVSSPPDPAVSPGEVVLKMHQAMGRLNDERGVDRRCGRLLFGRLRALGLVNLGAEAHMSMVQPASQLATLLRASYERRRGAMTDAGFITDDEFDRDLARMEAADFMMPSPIMWTAWGRRP
jgi:2-polyprenyl-3-methyl-5-hydroxy-6-metoxy-1,4-benzoquinol methylase